MNRLTIINLIDIYGLIFVSSFLFIFGVIGFLASSYLTSITKIIVWKYKVYSAIFSFTGLYLMFILTSFIPYLTPADVDGFSQLSLTFLKLETILLFFLMLIGFLIYIVVPLSLDILEVYREHKKKKQVLDIENNPI